MVDLAVLLGCSGHFSPDPTLLSFPENVRDFEASPGRESSPSIPIAQLLPFVRPNQEASKTPFSTLAGPAWKPGPAERGEAEDWAKEVLTLTSLSQSLPPSHHARGRGALPGGVAVPCRAAAGTAFRSCVCRGRAVSVTVRSIVWAGFQTAGTLEVLLTSSGFRGGTRCGEGVSRKDTHRA